MKTKISLLALVIFFTGANLVFAQANFSTARKDGASWTETSTFALDEKPWLHINVPETNFYDYWTFAYWNYPLVSYEASNHLNPVSEYYKKGTSDLYLSFVDSYWSSRVKTGEWNINAATVLFESSGAPNFWVTPTSHYGSAKFTVNPEPVSCALFLLGGGTLAVAGKLRRKA